jgi:hypothetical protein
MLSRNKATLLWKAAEVRSGEILTSREAMRSPMPNFRYSRTARMRSSYEYMNYLQVVQVFGRTPRYDEPSM